MRSLPLLDDFRCSAGSVREVQHFVKYRTHEKGEFHFMTREGQQSLPLLIPLLIPHPLASLLSHLDHAPSYRYT